MQRENFIFKLQHVKLWVGVYYRNAKFCPHFCLIALAKGDLQNLSSVCRWQKKRYKNLYILYVVRGYSALAV